MARIFSARDRRFGGYLDEYEPGDIYEHWPGKTITAAEDHMFCMLTMAASPLHVDRHWAESETEFGRNVVVGTFIYSLLLGMSVPDISGRAIASRLTISTIAKSSERADLRNLSRAGVA